MLGWMRSQEMGVFSGSSDEALEDGAEAKLLIQRC